jgi:hypothetical protein
MKDIRRPVLIGVVFVALALSLLGSCASGKQTDREQHPSVASVSPQPAKPIEQPREPPEVELFYGEGDCGPRFPNGMRGTCINNKPCSGFGVKDASGNLECDCFGVKGGCSEGKVCSVRKRACVNPQDDEK